MTADDRECTVFMKADRQGVGLFFPPHKPVLLLQTTGDWALVLSVFRYGDIIFAIKVDN